MALVTGIQQQNCVLDVIYSTPKVHHFVPSGDLKDGYFGCRIQGLADKLNLDVGNLIRLGFNI